MLLAPPCQSSTSPTRTPSHLRLASNQLQNTQTDQNLAKLKDNLKVDIVHTFGSSCWSCCRLVVRTIKYFYAETKNIFLPRTKSAVPSTSSGPTERRASSSWWTARPCPGCGGCTRTSQIWTMRPWAGLSGTITREAFWLRWMDRGLSISLWIFHPLDPSQKYRPELELANMW